MKPPVSSVKAIAPGIFMDDGGALTIEIGAKQSPKGKMATGAATAGAMTAGSQDADANAFNVVAKKTGEVVGKAGTKRGAMRSRDRRDMEYGGYEHRIEVDNQDEADLDTIGAWHEFNIDVPEDLAKRGREILDDPTRAPESSPTVRRKAEAALAAIAAAGAQAEDSMAEFKDSPLQEAVNVYQDVERHRKRVAEGIGEWMIRMPNNIAGGAIEAGDQAIRFAFGEENQQQASQWIGETFPAFTEFASAFKGQTETGDEMTQEIMQFMIPFTGYMKVLKALGAGTVTAGVGAEVMTMGAHFDPLTERFSGLLKQLGVDGPMLDYMVDTDGSDALNRAKLIVDSLAITATGAGIYLGAKALLEAAPVLLRPEFREEMFRRMQPSSVSGTPAAQRGAVGDLAQGPDRKVVAHKLPVDLLVEGHPNPPKPPTPVKQDWSGKKQAAIDNIDAAKAAHPEMLSGTDAWVDFATDVFGGDRVPAPPHVAMQYRAEPQAIADMLNKLPPDMKVGVDRGLENTRAIGRLYESGKAKAEDTANLFVWGILSRGAGPVQQESAFLAVYDAAQPYIQAAARGQFDDAMAAQWEKEMKTHLGQGNPGKSVTMNVNSAGKLLREMGTENANGVVPLQRIHEMMASGVPTKDIRREFFLQTNKPGIDNKVVSFIMLAAGRHDVLILDRIQAGQFWNDGRFIDNIYDGYRVEAGTGNVAPAGMAAILGGPRGLMIHEMLEEQLEANVKQAYEMVGRGDEFSMGRFHWETWVIKGEQVVDHATLQSIPNRSVAGQSVTEGKRGTYSSGTTYIHSGDEMSAILKTSDGEEIGMSLAAAQEMLKQPVLKKHGIIPSGFKVSEHKEAPWYESGQVDRTKLDALIRERGKPINAGSAAKSQQGKPANSSRRGTRSRVTPNAGGSS